MRLSMPFLLLSLGFSVRALATGAEVTLDQAFQAALRRADSVAIDSELIRQAEEQYQQAFGAMLPTVNASYVLTRQKKR